MPIADYEVYAFYGLAASTAQLFEHSLILLVVGLRGRARIAPIRRSRYQAPGQRCRGSRGGRRRMSIRSRLTSIRGRVSARSWRGRLLVEADIVVWSDAASRFDILRARRRVADKPTPVPRHGNLAAAYGRANLN
jgi:hypothetical protein